MLDEDLYCSIYVAGAADVDELAAAVDEIVRSRVRPGAGSSVLDTAVRAQSRHLPLDDEHDDFVLWRHRIEIEAADPEAGFDAFLAEVVQVVVGLRAGGLRVVAACDFEEELETAARAAGSR